MSTGTHPLAEIEAWLRDHRHHIVERLEIVMKYLEDLIAAQKRLIDARHAADQRAETAEKALADLQAQVEADEKSAQAALDAVNAEVAAEQPPVFTPSGNAPRGTSYP